MIVRHNMRNGQRTGWWGLVLMPLILAVPAAAQHPSDYYTTPQVYGTRPNPNGEYDLGPLGVTGIEARICPGVTVTVEDVQLNTPAHGKFNHGDIIVGVNGVLLEGQNPLRGTGYGVDEGRGIRRCTDL